MITSLDEIWSTRPIFNPSEYVELLYTTRRNYLHDPTLFESMATDEKKKKLESLRLSVSKLETQKVMAKGNKAKMDSIQKLIDRFERDIKTLKTL